METLLTFLTILAMIIIVIPFVIWVLIKFSKFHGDAIERKWTIIGISFAICIPLFILTCFAVVFVGMQVDAETLLLPLTYI